MAKWLMLTKKAESLYKDKKGTTFVYDKAKKTLTDMKTGKITKVI